MIWNNAQLFNIDELVPEEDGFFALRRLKDAKQTFPEDNILFQNKMPHGAELRFRLNGGKAKLVCRTAKGERGRAFVYFGRALLGEYAVGDSPAEVFAEMPVEQTVSRIGREGGSPFGEKIVRVVFDGAQFALGSLEGDISLPAKEDLPAVRGVVHGSSITAGYNSLIPDLSYVRVMERLLGAEIENLGFAGVCLAEDWIARRIAERGRYDFIALEFGVNVMYRIGEEEFARRVRAFLSELRKGTDAPVFCTDCFTFAYAQSKIPDEKYRAFKRAVQNAVSECGGKNSYYIDGETLLKDYRHLSADGVHPDVFGHMEIGSAFAEKIAARTGLKLQKPLF